MIFIKVKEWKKILWAVAFEPVRFQTMWPKNVGFNNGATLFFSCVHLLFAHFLLYVRLRRSLAPRFWWAGKGWSRGWSKGWEVARECEWGGSVCFRFLARVSSPSYSHWCFYNSCAYFNLIFSLCVFSQPLKCCNFLVYFSNFPTWVDYVANSRNFMLSLSIPSNLATPVES